MFGVRFRTSRASRPFSARSTSTSQRSSMLVKAKTLRTSSSTISTVLPRSSGSARCACWSIFRAARRQFRFNAVQKHRRFSQQSFRPTRRP